MQVATDRRAHADELERHAGAHAARAEISVLGRNTQGVRLIRLDEGERLIGVEPVEPEPDVDDEAVDGDRA